MALEALNMKVASAKWPTKLVPAVTTLVTIRTPLMVRFAPPPMPNGRPVPAVAPPCEELQAVEVRRLVLTKVPPFPTRQALSCPSFMDVKVSRRRTVLKTALMTTP